MYRNVVGRRAVRPDGVWEFAVFVGRVVVDQCRGIDGDVPGFCIGDDVIVGLVWETTGRGRGVLGDFFGGGSGYRAGDNRVRVTNVEGV